MPLKVVNDKTKFNETNKLVIVGNGFDLAHGLKTSYKDFMDWYIYQAFNEFCDKNFYDDSIIEIRHKYAGFTTKNDKLPRKLEEVLSFLSTSDRHSISYKSNFFKRLLDTFKSNNWVDIECLYFRLLKAHFSNNNLPEKKEIIRKLNIEFDFLIKQLGIYIETVNAGMTEVPRLKMDALKYNINFIFEEKINSLETKFLNFNYTDTVLRKYPVNENDVIHIHGRASEIDNNPLIFGYGDESDPIYQSIEDSGENLYLEHIKSFGYFRTSNYSKLLSYIDSSSFIVYIVGHSCGLSDRVLLNEIFEHQNCQKIEIFYHVSNDGKDNFKEITQEISRHFKPQNKNIMRRKIANKNIKNIIPQNSII